MKRTVYAIAAVVVSALWVNGATWFTSPSVSSGGNGSTSSPWPLWSALTNRGDIIPGDTLSLMPGTYSGNFVCTLNGVTIIPRDGISTVRLTDGMFGTLRTTLYPATSGSSTNVIIEGAAAWQVGQQIVIAGELLQLNIKSSISNWTVVRGWNGSIPTNHSQGDAILVSAPIISHTGTNCLFYGLEFTSVQATNRELTANGFRNWAVSQGINVDVGISNRIADCVFFNCGHPAIGWWEQGEGSYIDSCIVWGTGFFDWNGARWSRGSGIYAQNVGGVSKVRNLISFRNLTYGAKIYGETGPVRDFEFDRCSSFDNRDYTLEASSGSTITSNVWFTSNLVFGPLYLRYASFSNKNQYVIGNTILAGGLQSSEQTDSVYTNNTVLLIKNKNASESVLAESGVRNTRYASNALNIVWDNNRWYTGNGSSLFAWNYLTTDYSSGWQNFASWKTWSGYDVNSLSYTNWPTNYLQVQATQSRHTPSRWHVTIINTDTNRTTVDWNCGLLGYTNGYAHWRDAQNYFTGSAVPHSGIIVFPITGTNVSEITGDFGTHMTNRHTNVHYPGFYNAFVVDFDASTRVVGAKFRGIGLR